MYVTGPNGFTYSTSTSAAIPPFDAGETVSAVIPPPETSTTTLTPSVNPSKYGQSVTFAATVSVPTLTNGVYPPGQVSLTIDNSTTPVTVNLTGGQGSYSLGNLSVGTHTITASFGGNYTYYYSPSSTTIYETVGQQSTTTSLSYSGSFSYGQPLSLVATVSDPDPSGYHPTGSITFYDGSTALGTVALSGTSSSDSLPVSLSAGPHSFTAVYSGDGNFTGSTSSALVKTETGVSSATKLTASADPVLIGQPVTFTATVSQYATSTTSTQYGTPTGSVTFVDGSTTLGTAKLAGGVATLSGVTFAAAGTQTVQAQYSGDTVFGTSSATMGEYVDSPTTVTLTSSANPSAYGQSVSFTVLVAATNTSSTVAPPGQVGFSVDGGTPILVTISGGKAVLSTSSLMTVGTHSIVASYAGNSTYYYGASQSTPLSQVVGQQSTTTSLSYSGSFSYGQPLSLVATVSDPDSSSYHPTGSITFYDGSTSLGTVALSGTSSSVSLPVSLSAGSHSFTAVYSGDGNFTGSTSAAVVKTETGVTSTTKLAASANPVLINQPFTLTATVSQYATSTTATQYGTPTGSVTFVDGSTTLGTANLVGGVATLSGVTFAAAGTQRSRPSTPAIRSSPPARPRWASTSTRPPR